jgi:hypothetical protein
VSDTRDWAAWARENRVAFELTPLVERRGEERVQIGYALNLFAAFPMAKPAGKDRQEDAQRLRGEMQAFLSELAASDASTARTELEPPRTAAVLRPENELRPEIGLTMRIFHADEYLKAVTAAETEGLGRFAKRLVGMGLRQGHW